MAYKIPPGICWGSTGLQDSLGLLGICCGSTGHVCVFDMHTYLFPLLSRYRYWPAKEVTENQTNCYLSDLGPVKDRAYLKIQGNAQS